MMPSRYGGLGNQRYMLNAVTVLAILVAVGAQEIPFHSEVNIQRHGFDGDTRPSIMRREIASAGQAGRHANGADQMAYVSHMGLAHLSATDKRQSKRSQGSINGTVVVDCKSTDNAAKIIAAEGIQQAVKEGVADEAGIAKEAVQILEPSMLDSLLQSSAGKLQFTFQISLPQSEVAAANESLIAANTTKMAETIKEVLATTDEGITEASQLEVASLTITATSKEGAAEVPQPPQVMNGIVSLLVDNAKNWSKLPASAAAIVGGIAYAANVNAEAVNMTDLKTFDVEDPRALDWSYTITGQPDLIFKAEEAEEAQINLTQMAKLIQDALPSPPPPTPAPPSVTDDPYADPDADEPDPLEVVSLRYEGEALPTHAPPPTPAPLATFNLSGHIEIELKGVTDPNSIVTGFETREDVKKAICAGVAEAAQVSQEACLEIAGARSDDGSVADVSTFRFTFNLSVLDSAYEQKKFDIEETGQSNPAMVAGTIKKLLEEFFAGPPDFAATVTVITLAPDEQHREEKIIGVDGYILMVVPNTAAVIANMKAKKAIATAIGSVAGVPYQQVHCEESKAEASTLLQFSEMIQTGESSSQTLNISYDILAEKALKLEKKLKAVTEDEMKAALQTAFQETPEDGLSDLVEGFMGKTLEFHVERKLPESPLHVAEARKARGVDIGNMSDPAVANETTSIKGSLNVSTDNIDIFLEGETNAPMAFRLAIARWVGVESTDLMGLSFFRVPDDAPYVNLASSSSFSLFEMEPKARKGAKTSRKRRRKDEEATKLPPQMLPMLVKFTAFMPRSKVADSIWKYSHESHIKMQELLEFFLGFTDLKDVKDEEGDAIPIPKIVVNNAEAAHHEIPPITTTTTTTTLEGETGSEDGDADPAVAAAAEEAR